MFETMDICQQVRLISPFSLWVNIKFKIHALLYLQYIVCCDFIFYTEYTTEK